MLEDAELHLVETLDEAQAFLSWLGERRPVLGLDTETTGLRPYATDHLRLVQFGDARTGWAVSYRNWRGLIEQALGQYDGPVALHNANFDLHFLAQAGLPLPPLHRLHDTMLMDHLLDPMRAHGLKAVGERLWPGSGAGQFELDNDMRRNKWTWATVPENLRSYWVYSAWDPVLTARVAENLWPQIHERGLVDQYHREMAVQDIAYRMERKGLLIDPAYTDGLRAEWSTEMHELEAELEALGVGNPSAARQVAQAMQLTENWEPDDWTETGQPKMDEKVLKGIDSEISRRVLRFRRLRKWIGTYLETFLRDRDENDRLHPSIRTLRARTGRMSITGPPMQTLPSAKSGYGYHIRRCIVVPPGKALWAIDYDIQELRLFAHYSGDPAYMEAFAGGRDLHSYIAQLVYQDPTIGKGDQRREIAKAVGYARLYGAGPDKIADTAGVTAEEVRHFMQTFDATFTRAGEFIKELDTIGRRRLVEEGRPYVVTWGGRTLPADPDRIYALLNYLIQGTAADVLKVKMLELDGAGLGDSMLLPVHDELLFEFDEGDTEGPELARKIMEEHDAFSVPLLCGASGPYPDWGSKYLKE